MREHFKEAAASKMLSPRVSIIFAVYISFVNGQQDSMDACREGLSGRLRLQGGTEYAGRLEVCWNNNGKSRYQWMTVCDSRWGRRETIAACNQLNYNNTQYMGEV